MSNLDAARSSETTSASSPPALRSVPDCVADTYRWPSTVRTRSVNPGSSSISSGGAERWYESGALISPEHQLPWTYQRSSCGTDESRTMSRSMIPSQLSVTAWEEVNTGGV